MPDPTARPSSHDSPSPRPDPSVVPGLEPGGGVAPGDTPPGEDSLSGAAGGAERHTPNHGPISGNRTPMVITLVALGVLVLMTAGLVVASLIPS
jgi:hypothetical protein